MKNKHQDKFDLHTQHVADIIRFHGDNQGNKTALIFNEMEISYASLNEQANKLANSLILSGMSEQTRIAYLGKESEKYYALLFACAKANLVLVPINFRLKQNEISYILKDSQTKALFVDAEFSCMVDFLKAEINCLALCVFLQELPDKMIFDKWMAESPASDPLLINDNEQILAQIYTSGTTGLPKGVELPHKSFFQIRNSLLNNDLDWIDWREGDISLIGIPGFHIGGLWWSLQGFSAGITNVCLPFFLASDALTVMTKYKVSIACVVPAMISMLLDENNGHSYDLTPLRKMIYGGSPISEALLKRGIEKLGCEFAQIYGLTETGNTAVCLPPKDHVPGSKRMLAAGRPYPCVSLKIINEDGDALPPNQIGEILINSPARMKGYWNLPKETRNTLIDGWVHTGDAGYLDEDGYLYVCDRIKDTIIVAGEKIYPAEVENEISKHPAVGDVAVIGVPCDKWGEAVHAFIVLNAEVGLTARDLLLFLKDRIAGYKIPTKFVFIDKIPRNPSGKILRRELRSSFWSNQTRKIG